jgi:hypothetical protein
MHEGRTQTGCLSSFKFKEIVMRTASRFIPIAFCAAVVAVLAGCTVTPAVVSPAPATVVTPAPVVTPGTVIVR